MHNREHVVLIRPAEGGLLLHTLFYADELHATNKAEAPKAQFTAKELDMAKSLIGHLTAPFKPEQFHDTYRENVERLIEEKAKGHKITAVKQPRKAPVVDLMEALQQSLRSVEGASKARSGAKKSKTRRKAA
jgi:DNA end-binding protein Ku